MPIESCDINRREFTYEVPIFDSIPNSGHKFIGQINYTDERIDLGLPSNKNYSRPDAQDPPASPVSGAEAFSPESPISDLIPEYFDHQSK